MSLTATREKPVLFSDAMVRAILDGRKTCTRRLVKPQPVRLDNGLWLFQGKERTEAELIERLREVSPWRPGHRLWVRECWGLWDTQPSDGPENATILYRATEGHLHQNRYQLWRPSIHMPRWASRITLGVVAVDPVQVQEINELEAKEEGVPKHDGSVRIGETHRAEFACLWESLYPGSWDRNDWVYANEFVVERTGNQ